MLKMVNIEYRGHFLSFCNKMTVIVNDKLRVVNGIKSLTIDY